MSTVIKIQNINSWLITDNLKLKKRLWEGLRFMEKGYFHKTAYKKGFWDGYRDFFNKNSGQFLTGLLPEILASLKLFGVDYQINDERNSITWKYNQIDQKFLMPFLPEGLDPFDLYDYQVDYVNQAIKHSRGIIKSPTGCHRKGQKIIMFDGSLKKVEDIQKNDLLMGMDGTSRKVLKICRGFDEMYKISPKKGKPFFVNGEHVLTLVRIKSGNRCASENLDGKLVDVKVKDWIKWTKWKKHIHKLIRTIDFKNNVLRIGFSVEKVANKEKYYGFQIDGDQRYLLDDFTVTHNSGKTNVMISILKCLPENTPVLFMTKGSALVHQNYLDMQDWGIPNLGRWYGNYKELNRIMCVTAHTATYDSLKKLLPKFKVLIVDEVHECMSDVPIKFYRTMKNTSVRFGVSATPFKFTKKNKKGEEDCKDKVHKFQVKGYFGGVFKTKTTETGYLTTQDLQKRGILSRSKCTFYPIDSPKNIQHEPYIDAVTLGISNNFEFLKTIQKLTKTLYGRTLVLVERIDQGEYLNQLIPGSVWIQGKDDLAIRAKVFQDLKYSGENVIAISMRQIITAGINVFIHNLVNAAGGKAEHSIIQQMGRGLRCAQDKEILDYYDFIFNTNHYLHTHSKQRLDTIANEGHMIVVKEKIDF